MTNWLTTGRMIDKLKVREVAENEDGIRVKNINNQIFYIDNQGEIKDIYGSNGLMIIGQPQLKAKWRILPNYVSFEEAMKALKDGKKVKVIYPNGEHDYIFHRQRDIHLPNTTWNELFEGKWTIEGDDE